ncbi:ROK family transcriptional regulator [Leifsonia xyli subsp. xyli]|uniref:Transcriptional regulator, ROK family n=2 Tax=Leifsonia xyli subsp. xyli TaxID=59736 RepID=Q6AHJ6_LEIXX|nr:ROK family protein [Leifsonia xyli]AAT88149.1 transcriptional regulator, ROK family [Leifsonia xyli subsp. xyli str. CTCB07]ODA89888.1 ROK family transcriptional regulator [Leifsonia xyli subsp. xyli]
MPRGANLPAIAAFNETVVLDAVRRSADGLSRVEVAAATGLSAQTVTNVTRRLLAQGVIREAGKHSEGSPGKPRTILRLDPAGAYAIGVHLDPTVITCVLLDLEGVVVNHLRCLSSPDGDAVATLAVAAEAIAVLLTTQGVDSGRAIGVGVATPGPIDTETGVVVRPPLIPGWNDFHLRDELTAATGLPVLLAKDVTSAAVAERWHGPAGASGDYAFVYYGTGVGVGFVLGGSVYTGFTDNAVDVGHALVDPGGALCACGRRGCYGESVRPYRLVMQGLWAGILPVPPGLEIVAGEDAPLDVETVDALFTCLAAAAAAGDERAVEIVDRSIRSTAFYLSNLTALLDLDRVVFGGPFWTRVESRYLDQLPQRLAELHIDTLTHPTAIVASAVGDDVAAVGAACLVLDATSRREAKAEWNFEFYIPLTWG